MSKKISVTLIDLREMIRFYENGKHFFVEKVTQTCDIRANTYVNEITVRDWVNASELFAVSVRSPVSNDWTKYNLNV